MDKIKKKHPTNEDILIHAIKNLQSHEVAFLRERILFVCDLTISNIDEHPEKWENSIVHPTLYRKSMVNIKEAIGFEDDKPREEVKS